MTAREALNVHDLQRSRDAWKRVADVAHRALLTKSSRLWGEYRTALAAARALDVALGLDPEPEQPHR